MKILKSEVCTYYINKNATITISKWLRKHDHTAIIPEQINGVNVTEIGAGAFLGLDIYEVFLPECLQTIGKAAFGLCFELMYVNFPENLERIEDNAFSDCMNLKEVIIPKNVKKIGQNPFGGCFKLKKIEVSDENEFYESMDGVLFDKEKNVLIAYPVQKRGFSYEVPDSVRTIGAYAFEASRLYSVILSEGLCEIQRKAFYDCMQLHSITIPKTVTSIDDNLAYGCSNLRAINVQAENQIYESSDGVLFNKKKRELVCCPDGKKDEKYLIPKGTAIIGDESFAFSRIREIIIPDSVTVIGKGVFRNYTYRGKINIPKSVVAIGEEAFNEDSKLIVKEGSYTHLYAKEKGISHTLS